MSELIPSYDACIEPVLHCRCTICGCWWHLECAHSDRAYWCPHCGRKLDPPQYSDAPKIQRPEIPTGSLEL